MKDQKELFLKKRLEEHENTLIALLNLIPDLVLKISDKGDFLECKAGSDEDLFAPVLEIIGSNINDIFPEDLSDQFFYYINKAIETKVLQVCEYKLKINAGLQEYEARFVASSTDTVMVLIRNITKRKTAEETLTQMIVQLEESQDNLLSILNQMGQGSAITDTKGKIIFMNQEARALFQLKDTDCLGVPWVSVFPVSEFTKKEIRTALDVSPKSRQRIVAKVVSNRGTMWIEIEVKDHPHMPLKKIFFFYDVSEVYRLRTLLKDKSPYKGLVGNSAVMQRIFQQISELAPSDVPVLIQGETGTGKELVAKAIHQASVRQDKPFVAVNCAGLMTDALLSSQLFGHKRGSFTGAVQDQKGYLEEADGGTLFLDEIGDMSLSVQTQLLRFLQEKEIVRVGEAKARKLNVRIIAASQHDLDQEVKKGNFRMDLLFRIKVATIDLPPLRERREDIPLLVAHFIKKFGREYQKKVQQVSNEALQILITHYWSGNVRELESVMRMAIVSCQGAFINTADLPMKGLKEEGNIYQMSEEKKLSPKQRIMTVLEESHGNKSRAAKLLGVSRSTLYRKMRSMSISSEVFKII